jgi:hypothetical protein
MTQVSAPRIQDGTWVRLGWETAHRAAAAALSRAAPDEITATTVLGVVGADDLDTFRGLVADIADEYDVDASLQIDVGQFSVRFTHPVRATVEPAPGRGESLWARILRRADRTT